MALQFGNTKIGGMQYNGVTIGEAMYNGQIVYRSGPRRYVAENTYPVGEFGPRLLQNTWTDLDVHTVTHPGLAVGQWSGLWFFLGGGETYQLRVLLNGSVIGSSTYTGPGSSSIPNYIQQIDTPEIALTAGDVIVLQGHTNSSGPTRRNVFWWWTLS